MESEPSVETSALQLFPLNFYGTYPLSFSSNTFDKWDQIQNKEYCKSLFTIKYIDLYTHSISLDFSISWGRLQCCKGYPLTKVIQHRVTARAKSYHIPVCESSICRVISYCFGELTGDGKWKPAWWVCSVSVGVGPAAAVSRSLIEFNSVTWDFRPSVHCSRPFCQEFKNLCINLCFAQVCMLLSQVVSFYNSLWFLWTVKGSNAAPYFQLCN